MNTDKKTLDEWLEYIIKVNKRKRTSAIFVFLQSIVILGFLLSLEFYLIYIFIREAPTNVGIAILFYMAITIISLLTYSYSIDIPQQVKYLKYVYTNYSDKKSKERYNKLKEDWHIE